MPSFAICSSAAAQWQKRVHNQLICTFSANAGYQIGHVKAMRHEQMAKTDDTAAAAALTDFH
jgi:hypothetical protein